MTIGLGDIYCPASPKMRKFLADLARKGVVDVYGCVVMSKLETGELPPWQGRVVADMKAGCPPLGRDERRAIHSAVIDEVLLIVDQMIPGHCDAATLVAAEYSLTPPEGIASLCIETCGLVDHEVKVVLS